MIPELENPEWKEGTVLREGDIVDNLRDEEKNVITQRILSSLRNRKPAKQKAMTRFQKRNQKEFQRLKEKFEQEGVDTIIWELCKLQERVSDIRCQLYKEN
jgi:hypothetical protein